MVVDFWYYIVDDELGGTITILGELTHPDIDYTPHYGIEKNIGIGTTGIQISGTTSAFIYNHDGTGIILCTDSRRY